MAKLNILRDGDPTLRKICRPVDVVTPRIRTLLDDMVETMPRRERLQDWPRPRWGCCAGW